jgi:tRNA pseudouridine38-40 synthase
LRLSYVCTLWVLTVPRYALELEFDGAAFLGTQVQDARLRTLQAVMESTLLDLTSETTRFRASSRLDAGVSAEALPGDCWLDRAWQPITLGLALNARLPHDVAVKRVAIVSDDWDARRSSVKTYRYRVLRQNVRPVLDRRGLWIRELSQPELLQRCADLIPGDHDMSGFSCLRGDETDDNDPSRRYLTAQWTRSEQRLGECWTFRISGEGFLYKQVRGMVGAMLHIGKGRQPFSSFSEIMSAGRSAPRCGNIAPSHPLTLERVDYNVEPDWQAI